MEVLERTTELTWPKPILICCFSVNLESNGENNKNIFYFKKLKLYRFSIYGHSLGFQLKPIKGHYLITQTALKSKRDKDWRGVVKLVKTAVSSSLKYFERIPILGGLCD